MNNYMIGAIMFVVGMLAMNSLTGEYYRYGMEVSERIEDCEIEQGKECDIIIAPVTSVPHPSSFSPLPDVSLGLHHQNELNPNQDTKARVS